MALSENEKVAHLLRRFGLGASESELEYYGKNGLNGAISLLLDYDSSDDFGLKLTDFAPKKGVPRPKSAQIMWALRMCSTRKPLQEKLTLFWHHHFATAVSKVDVAPAIARQNDLLRENCLGTFRNLLLSVSKDPAMLYWLDNQFNVKGKPNENFAREVMELFTLGIGNYSEKDVQEAARAFTGWTYGVGRRTIDKPRGPSQFQFRAELHDSGTKSVLGNTGNFDGDDVCGILVGHPATAEFITRKMWEWFAYQKPEPELIKRLAAEFRNSGLNIKVLVKSIMTAPEFYSEKCVGKLFKNPVDFCVVTFRQLGIGSRMLQTIKDTRSDDDGPGKLGAAQPLNLLITSMTAMGMEILNPPDVSGWSIGPAWVSSATMVERIKWADALFMRGRYPAVEILGEGATGKEAAVALCSIFDVHYASAKIEQLAKAANSVCKGSVTPRNANATAAAVCKLIFGSPEFQFC